MLFYFYTGDFSGVDHKEPLSAHCAIICGVECNRDLGLVCVYMANDDKTFPALC